MHGFSTREAAKKLGIEHSTLAKYIKRGKVLGPETVKQGKRISHVWTEEEIESLRKLLPKIANGRKTRYQKQSAVSTHGKAGQAQESAKTKKKTQARVPAPHKKK